MALALTGGDRQRRRTIMMPPLPYQVDGSSASWLAYVQTRSAVRAACSFEMTDLATTSVAATARRRIQSFNSARCGSRAQAGAAVVRPSSGAGEDAQPSRSKNSSSSWDSTGMVIDGVVTAASAGTAATPRTFGN